MHPLRIQPVCFLLIAFVLSPNTQIAAQDTRVDGFQRRTDDWPWWRGPDRNGVADPNQEPPLNWDASTNVVWKAEIPGKGHSSPIVYGEKVLVTSSDEEAQTQSVICYDRNTGETLWKSDVHTSGVSSRKSNKKASLASNSVATDGQRIYANFFNSDAAYTTALSMDGRKVWQTKTTNYVVHQGYASSPALYRSLVIITADTKRGGIVAGLNRETGDFVWKHARPKDPNYPSPVILNVNGRDQLLLTGCDLVSGYSPADGKKLWEFKGATTECVTSTVTNGQLVYTSGGYPKNHISAVHATDAGKVEWENGSRVYVPSMVLRDNLLYAVADAGIAMCLNASTGEERWRGRLGGTFSSSPILVGDRIYATNENGTTFVFSAGEDKFELLSKNNLGDEVFATPAICGGRIFMRVAHHGEKRQEMLYCLGEE